MNAYATIDITSNYMQSMNNTDYIKNTDKEFATTTTVGIKKCIECNQDIETQVYDIDLCVECYIKNQEKQWSKISKKYNGAILI